MICILRLLVCDSGEKPLSKWATFLPSVPFLVPALVWFWYILQCEAKIWKRAKIYSRHDDHTLDANLASTSLSRTSNWLTLHILRLVWSVSTCCSFQILSDWAFSLCKDMLVHLNNLWKGLHLETIFLFHLEATVLFFVLVRGVVSNKWSNHWGLSLMVKAHTVSFNFLSNSVLGGPPSWDLLFLCFRCIQGTKCFLPFFFLNIPASVNTNMKLIKLVGEHETNNIFII